MALDPSYFFYSDGTISLTNGSDIATGNFTAWDPAVLPFDFVFPNDGLAGMSVIEEVLAMDQIRLAKPWTGPTLTDVPYFMVRWVRHTDPRVYAVRVSDYLTRLKAIPENIGEIAADINADADTVAAAMSTLAQIEANVDADRQAAQNASGAAQGSASAAAGSATTAQQWAEAASSGVLPNNSVTNAKLADMTTGRIKGRVTGGVGDPEDLTASQVMTMLGFTQSLGTSGYQKLPSGIIIQWGRASSANTDVPITFPMAFPVACRSLVVNAAVDPGAASVVAVMVDQIDGTLGAALRPRVVVNGGAVGMTSVVMNWIAVGY